jgi:Flp pilus assembly protein TadD
MRLLPQTFALAASAILVTGCGAFQSTQSREPRVTLRVAEAAMASGAPDLALRVADIVLARRPDDVAALLARADALYAMGDAVQAGAAYRRAAALEPSSAAAQIGLGRTLIRNEPQAAEAAFMAAAAQQPDNVTALNDLGIARDMLGRHADAQKAYRQALAVSPDSADVRTNLDLSLALAGQPADRPSPPVAALTRSAPPVTVTYAAPAIVTAPVPEAPPPAAAQPPLAVRTAPVTTVARQNLPPRPAVAVMRAPDPVPPAELRADLSDATASLPATDPDSALPPLATGLSFAAPLESLQPKEPEAPPVPSAQDSARAPVKQEQPAGTGAQAPANPVADAVEAALDPGASMARGGSVESAADPAPPSVTAGKPGPRAQPEARPLPAQPVNRWSVAGYFVQIAALNSDRDARAEWQRLRNRLPDLLAGHEPVVEQAEVNQRMFWRLRTGSFTDTGSADDFCRKLRASGLSCWSGSGL